MPSPRTIAICGCGPAGLAAALLLKRAGHDVALFERFGVPKPVGSGLILQPTGLAVLDLLGLSAEIRALGSPIRRLFGTAVRSGRVALDVRYPSTGDDGQALAVHRAGLFGVLLRAVQQCGIPTTTNATMTQITTSASAPALIDSDGQRYGPFDIVIDATGGRSALAQSIFGARFRPLAYGALWANAPWPGPPFAGDELQQRYDRASVMIGVLPIGRRQPGSALEAAFFWSLKTAEYDDWRRAGVTAWRQQVEALWPETAPILETLRDPEQLVLASYNHHTLARAHSGHVAAIGDAAHSTSPQLGQGANMALLDALAMAQALATEDQPAAALGLYARMRRRHVWLYQGLSTAFTPFYQSDSVVLPALRDRLYGPLIQIPGINAGLASLVSGQWSAPVATIARYARSPASERGAGRPQPAG